MKPNFFLVAAVVLSFTSVPILSLAQSAEQLLTRDLLATAKTLKNEIKLYNYFTLQEAWPELQSESGRKGFINRYLSERAGSFWDANFTDASTKNYAAGPALYLAIDPSISQSYGNSFIEMSVPAGTKFINVVKPIPVKKDTMTALVIEGFTTKEGLSEIFPKLEGFYRDTLRVMVLPQNHAFRNLVQRIFAANGIQFVEYNFNTSLSGFCSKHSYSAFAFVGQQNGSSSDKAYIADQFSDITLFSTNFGLKNQSFKEQSDFSRIVKFREVLDGIPVQKKAGNSVKEYILKNYSPAEVQQVKAVTFSCDS